MWVKLGVFWFVLLLLLFCFVLFFNEIGITMGGLKIGMELGTDSEGQNV